MRNLLLLILNNLKVTFRKKGNIIIYVFLPLFGVLLSSLMYGSFGGTSSSSLKIGFVDYDRGITSIELREKFDAVDGFEVFSIEEEEINSMLLAFDIDAAVIVPKNYSESIYSGDAADIEVISLKGQVTTVWIEQVINGYTASMLRLSSASGGEQAVFQKMLGQVEDNSIKLKVIDVNDRGVGKAMTVSSIGFLIMFIMLGTGLTSMIILREKRDRTYHRICSAPVSARQYILANSLTSLLISIIQIVLILLAIKYVFRIDMGADNLNLFLVLLMFALVAIGLGLVISAFASSSYMAGTLTTLIMTPSCMLGGCYWDVSLMPDFMQKISYLVPQRWAIDAVTKMQTGSSLWGISWNLLVLAAFALALTLIAVYKFSRGNNVQKFI